MHSDLRGFQRRPLFEGTYNNKRMTDTPNTVFVLFNAQALIDAHPSYQVSPRFFSKQVDIQHVAQRRERVINCICVLQNTCGN